MSSTDKYEVQHTTAAAEDHDDGLNEDVHYELAIPEVKSGVRVDVNAVLQKARFEKGNIVHMSVVSNGQRQRGVYTILTRRYNARGGYIEYQFKEDVTGNWYREKDLKIERR